MTFAPSLAALTAVQPPILPNAAPVISRTFPAKRFGKNASGSTGLIPFFSDIILFDQVRGFLYLYFNCFITHSGFLYNTDNQLYAY
jgi:hypothetical protein